MRVQKSSPNFISCLAIFNFMEKTKEKEIGRVAHWYDKIKVAVVKLTGVLNVGDKIKVKRGEEEFEDSVSSMQLDHAPVQSGKKDQEVAIKLSQQAKEGALIFKVE